MELKIVSFNIRNADDKNGNSIAERAPRLYKVISDIDPDLIGIQEFTPAWEEHFERYFAPKYEMFNIYRDTTGWKESGPLLFRRGMFTLIDKGWFWFSDTPEKESVCWDTLGYKRMCVYLILRENKTGKRFVFMDTHFGFGHDEQVKTARLIKENVQKLSSMPLFITGDFNATPDTDTYKEMTSFMTDASADDTKSYTFHAYQPGLRDKHIDYCFTNGKCVSKGVRVITETVEGKYPSDHYGLDIKLEIG